MGGQVHGAEHGHKAAAEQGEKVGAKHHGKDAYTHALISGPQERMVFRQARFGDTGVSC